MKRLFSLLLFVPAFATAQQPAAPVQPSLEAIRARELGPTAMGGRVIDIAVYEKDPRIFYVGSASGGLWKTENAGTTMTPLFTDQGTASIGAVAVSQQNADLVYVGTGEGSGRNSSSWGDGVYRSEDGGKTWTNVGLRDSAHIGRIAIPPGSSDTLFVAAQGTLWGPNAERGIYKSTDRGKTWRRVLFVDERTGATDVAIDPHNPRNMLAATWQRARGPSSFASGGPGSGIWRSTDGGETWRRVTRGLPVGPLGRIGLSYFRKDPRIVIATVEAEGGGVFRSTDGGQSWTRVSGLNPRPFYFSRPLQDPSDVNRIYLLGIEFHYSDDAGRTFRTMPLSVHVDHHAIWVNPADSNNFLIGNDGGVSMTRDRGKTWQFIDYPRIAQFYAVAFDFRQPYWVYGGLQDNGSWAGPTQTSGGGVQSSDWYTVGGGDGFHVQVDPSNWEYVYSESQGGRIQRLNQRTGERRFISPTLQGERLRFNWSTPIEICPYNPMTVYVGANRLFRSVNRGDSWQVISPDLTTDDPALQRPAGGISPENTGAESGATIVTISESPRKQGVIWVGTDDGQVQVTQNGGQSWANVTLNIPDLPSRTWCSRLTASKYADGRAYATFDGHRTNDYNPYLFVTEDYGKTWKRLGRDLGRNESTYVIKEGLRNEDLLFVGTETGLWISLDRGANWQRYRSNGFPTVPVHDIAIQPRDQEAVIGTHGRGIWLMPVDALEQLTAEALRTEVVLMKPRDMMLMGSIGRRGGNGDAVYVSRNSQPSATIYMWFKSKPQQAAALRIQDVAGNAIGQYDLQDLKQGLNSFSPGGPRGFRLREGSYRVTLTVGQSEYIQVLRVVDIAGGTAIPAFGGGEEQKEPSDADPADGN